MTADKELWTWVVTDGSGLPVPAPVAGWHSRFDAEAWLGEHWRELADTGARRAVLRHGGAPVGGGTELRAFAGPVER